MDKIDGLLMAVELFLFKITRGNHDQFFKIDIFFNGGIDLRNRQCLNLFFQIFRGLNITIRFNIA